MRTTSELSIQKQLLQLQQECTELRKENERLKSKLLLYEKDAHNTIDT